MLLAGRSSVAPSQVKEHGGGRLGGLLESSRRAPAGHAVVRMWQHGQGALAVEEAGYRDEGDWVL